MGADDDRKAIHRHVSAERVIRCAIVGGQLLLLAPGRPDASEDISRPLVNRATYIRTRCANNSQTT